MKKYIITDPCYLISDNAIWGGYRELTFDDIAEQLGTTVQVASTGYGDWTNSLACVKGPNRLMNGGYFCADAGMVCFCELTPQVERALRDLGPGAYAEIEAEDPVCEFDCSNRDWTRIKITDGNSIYRSEECDFFDDEDDY